MFIVGLSPKLDNYLRWIKLGSEVCKNGRGVFAAGLSVSDDNQRRPFVPGQKVTRVNDLKTT